MSEHTTESAQPDWDKLARETPWDRDTWIAAAMYLGDLPEWRDLWPMVVKYAARTGVSPYSAAMQVREFYLRKPPGGDN